MSFEQYKNKKKMLTSQQTCVKLMKLSQKSEKSCSSSYKCFLNEKQKKYLTKKTECVKLAKSLVRAKARNKPQPDEVGCSEIIDFAWDLDN